MQTRQEDGRYGSAEACISDRHSGYPIPFVICTCPPHRVTQIALAWLLAQKPWIAPIPGSRKLEHLEDNIGAVAVEFTVDDLQEMESTLSKITVQGARYPESAERQTGR